MVLSQPRGVKDFGPGEAIARKRIIAVIEEIYKRFGFSPIETPSMESMSILNAKPSQGDSTKSYGEETNKEIYKIEDDDSGLRFDLTLPMVRYVAMNSGMPLPFKRYQIGAAWRRDEPQKMRYREFCQADVDIVGSGGIEADLEVMVAAALAIEELGIEYKIMLNSRVLLDSVLTSFNVPKEKHVEVIRAIDKLHKLGAEGVVKQIAALGVQERDAQKIIEFIEQAGDNPEKLERLEANIGGAKEEVAKIRQLLSLLSAYGLEEKVVIDPTLARGLDYYTGFVWEYIAYSGSNRLPSIGGGGRYDNLLGLYAKQGQPAVGASIGIDRVYDLLVQSEPQVKTYSKLFIGFIGEENYLYALSVANRARTSGVYTDINLTKRNISKQLEYANALKFRYAIIVGNVEKTAGNVKLRDLVSGDEVALSIEEALEKIKGN